MVYNELTPEEKYIILDKGTEAPFSGELNANKEQGVYTCKQCNQALFKSDSKQKAEIIANKLRESIEDLKIEHKGNSASSFVTASVGLVCLKAQDIVDEDQVYKMADDLLYQAKENGRNKVCINKHTDKDI